MKNKMATKLGTISFNKKKMTPQCDDETLRSTAEILVIQFDQERFEQVLNRGGKSPTNVRKHRKISVIRSPLITAEKQAYDKTKKAICRPELASCEAKHLKSVLLSTETHVTTHKCLCAAR